MITALEAPQVNAFVQKLNLDKPIAFTDVESTGTDIVKDRICSVAIVKIFPEGDPLEFYSLVNPCRPIPPESTEKHGITDEMVKDAPKFKDVAPDLLELYHGSDIGGYNVQNFDMGILYEESVRCGIEFKCFIGCRVIDPCSIFKKREERSLEAAVKFFCGGREMKGAHNALVDVKETINVLAGQFAKYLDLPLGVKELSEYCAMNGNRVDLAGKFVKCPRTGDVLFNFGNSKGEPISTNPGLLHWMQDKDFSAQTKAIARSLIQSLKTNPPLKPLDRQAQLL